MKLFSLYKNCLQSVKAKLILNVVLIHAVMMSLVIYDLGRRERNFMKSELSQKGYALSSLIAAQATSDLLNNDLVALEELLYDMDKIKEHYMIFILDRHGKVKASTRKEYLNKTLDDEDSRYGFSQLFDNDMHAFQHRHEYLTDTFHVIEVDGRAIGSVRTLLDEHSLSSELKNITTKGLWYLFIAVIAGGFFAWLAVRKITNRLNHVAIAAEKIANKDFDVELPVSDDEDELSKMINAFHVMSESIHEYLEELSSSTARLRESEENLLEAQKISHIGSWELDVMTGAMVWSPETYRINEKDPNTYQPTLESFYTNLNPTDIQAMQSTIAEAISTRERKELESKLYLDDGKIKYVKVAGIAEYDKNGNPSRIKGTTQDITQQKLDELKLEAREKQLLVQSRLAQMGEMISMIAHQWRQPLSAISATSMGLRLKLMMNSFDLQTQEGQKECKEYYLSELETIEAYVQSLSETISDFRNFYKPNKEFSHVSLDAIVAKALNIIKISLDNQNIELVYKDNSKNEINVFDGEIMQVVLNILKNSQDNFLEKKTDNPRITITTGDMSIAICDNGGGISEDIMDKIYDPYFSSKSAKNGTGLGLYMSKIIIEEHHKGSLVAENNAEGVCFFIEFGKPQ